MVEEGSEGREKRRLKKEKEKRGLGGWVQRGQVNHPEPFRKRGTFSLCEWRVILPRSVTQMPFKNKQE